MQLPKTFSQCLSDLMKKNKISISKLGTQLHCRTELKRILSEQSNHKKREQLLHSLIENEVFSPEDIELLCVSLNVSRIGVESWLSRNALLELLSHDHVQPRRNLQLIGGGLLGERLSSLADADSIDILCVNCCYFDLYHSLATLFEDKTRQIRMRHYIRISNGGHNTPTIINAVMPILFDSRYHLYRLESSYSQISNSQGIAGNVISLLVKKGTQTSEYFFIINDHSAVYELPSSHANNLFAFLADILADPSAPYKQIKEHLDGAASYNDILMRIFSLELNRVTYYLSPDLCYMQIPTHIGLRAFQENTVFPPELKERLIDSSMTLHAQRHHNYYYKHKHNYSAISLNGCRNFLETGRSTDHFIGFRNFTIAERLEIFALMIQQANESPFYHPCLLKEPTFFSKYICVCYEQHGMVLSPYDTSYEMNTDDQMILLKIPELTSLYADYFCDSLLSEHCYTKKESVTILTDLYNEYCEKYKEKPTV